MPFAAAMYSISVAAENALAQSITPVAEGGLEGHDHVVGKSTAPPV
jgi:hypothetical protein